MVIYFLQLPASTRVFSARVKKKMEELNNFGKLINKKKYKKTIPFSQLKKKVSYIITDARFVNTQYGRRVVVEIDGNYDVFLPALLGKISSRAIEELRNDTAMKILVDSCGEDEIKFQKIEATVRRPTSGVYGGNQPSTSGYGGGNSRTPSKRLVDDDTITTSPEDFGKIEFLAPSAPKKKRLVHSSSTSSATSSTVKPRRVLFPTLLEGDDAEEEATNITVLSDDDVDNDDAEKKNASNDDLPPYTQPFF